MEKGDIRCPLAKEEDCHKTFMSNSSAHKHARDVHGENKWPCPSAENKGCPLKFSTKDSAAKQALRFHAKKDSDNPPKEGFPCPLNCDKTYATQQNANRHAQNKHTGISWPCPSAEKEKCTAQFNNKCNANRHAKKAHRDKSTQKQIHKDRPYSRAREEKCSRMFQADSYARTHSLVKHGKAEPDEPFFPAWPTTPDDPLKDVEGKTIPGWAKLPKPSFVDGKWTFPDPGCSMAWASIWSVKNHYLASNKRLGVEKLASKLGSKRQRTLEDFFDSMRLNKKKRRVS
ncbi:hypothetical protein N7517_006781 [Penicillium concentricum]|uniref:C2H2-type domain-containing protein n=1 Tax=Penicillium concentricum TaxID=293559 RepID=A0A9W9SB54_9EURO|nr:uncharacterized protein N7517_006781 [Penicillium concentricum]KAJ5374775.1 hypothetical protein N7517_006781 [Penicillium concentricum]